VRPRLGYITGSWLFYVTGGLALADVKLKTAYSDSNGNAISNDLSHTNAGWTVGAGLGYAFHRNWSVKAEYLYADLGSITATAALPNNIGTVSSQGKARTNIVRAGIDYHF
jgi:outer membrane immunogenic protein